VGDPRRCWRSIQGQRLALQLGKPAEAPCAAPLSRPTKSYRGQGSRSSRFHPPADARLGPSCHCWESWLTKRVKPCRARSTGALEPANQPQTPPRYLASAIRQGCPASGYQSQPTRAGVHFGIEQTAQPAARHTAAGMNDRHVETTIVQSPKPSPQYTAADWPCFQNIARPNIAGPLGDAAKRPIWRYCATLAGEPI